MKHYQRFIKAEYFTPKDFYSHSLTKVYSRKGFVSAVCDTIYTIHQSLCTQSADPNPFRCTNWILLRSSSAKTNHYALRGTTDIYNVNVKFFFVYIFRFFSLLTNCKRSKRFCIIFWNTLYMFIVYNFKLLESAFRSKFRE